MTKKIKFIVIYTTDEDPQFPASELNTHGPTVHGWRSNQNCRAYPQELILKFNSPARVQRIQVLGHQFMIPEKIELWLHNADKETPTTPSAQSFEYLGFITLSDNLATNYASRELQSVTVEPKVGTHLKLRISAPYRNDLNETGQVSLLAINVLGETELDSRPPTTDDSFCISICDDLSFCMYVEESITEVVRELEAKKIRAVNEERFEYARKLKLCTTNLRVAGERLGRYSLAKRQAVAQEDFITAKLRKEQIRLYQTAVFSQLEVEKLLERMGTDPENDSVSPAYSQKPILPSPPSLQEVAARLTSTVASPNPNRSAPMLFDPDAVTSACIPKQYPDDVLHSPQLSKLGRSPLRNSPSGSLRRRNRSIPRNSYDDFDERTLPALKTSHTNEFLRECQDTGGDFMGRGRSKLNDRERRQAAIPILIFGMEMVEQFYSKHFQDREEALIRLRSTLKQDESVLEYGPNKVARSATVLLYRAVRDAVFSVFSQAAETVRVLFLDFVTKNKVAASEIARSVDKLLPELLAKSGDPSARIHTLAQHTILSIANCTAVHQQNLIAPSLSRPVGSGTHPRLAMSRLQMLEQLVLMQGISADKQSGLTCRILTESGCSGIHHPAETVRKVAERILLLVYRTNRRLVRKQLPPDDDVTRRNLLYRQLFQEFDKIDSERKNESQLTDSNNSENSRGDSLTVVASNGDGKGATVATETAGDVDEEPDERPPTVDICPFCDEECGNDDLDKHYWKSCPLLTKCPQCSLVLEVATFASHLTKDCNDAKLSYKICRICGEAVHKELMELHSEQDYCKAIAEDHVRCPLCHDDVESRSWKQHYVNAPGCAGNSKRKPRK